MNFSGTTPNDIYEWIEKKNNGDDTYYLNGKQDTDEAIDVFQSLYGCAFKNAYRLFLYLHQHLCMRVADSQSLYRAFIVLNNDEIITFRLSTHFSTKDTAKRAFKRTGKPNIEYHLVINRVKPLNPNADIYYDRTLSYVEIKVREYDLNEFNDNRKAIADEIVFLLTNGTQPPKITDNKQYTNMSKQVIRLTEGDLHNIIKESLNEILDDPYDYAKVNGLSAAAFKAAKTPNADPKWAERKMRQSNVIKDRSEKLRSEFSKMNGNNPYADFAMSGVDVHRIKQGLHDPKGYIRRNGYGNYLKGVTESDLHNIIRESVQKILKETYDPCDELGHLRWCNRDYRNDNKEAQRVGKVRGNALANWHKLVKDSESKVQEEGYTSNVSYTDANKPSNRPQIGTLDYYRRNDRMQVGQQPMYNNPNNWDNTEGWYSERSQNRRDSQPFNANMFPRSANPMSNMAVEESVNEVMYNGVSYHGTNPYDWVDIADERSQMGWKNRDDVSKYNQARFKAKDQGDLEGAEAASIMADKHRQQWNKNWGAAERNRNNAKQLGWQGQNDTRLGKAQEYYNMSQNAQNPQDRQKYNKMAQDTLGDVEGRAQKSLNMLRAARGQA